MNIHVVLEGEQACKKVYKCWIPLVNPNLTYVEHISQIIDNNFSITIGGGYPQYLDVIHGAIQDVNSYDNIDRLVIAVDSEEFTYDEKYQEISEYVSQFECAPEIVILIQHFCMETWALGNRVIFRPNPQDIKLLEYRRYYNVRVNDPELLPSYSRDDLNRSQFAYMYLRRALHDKYRNLSYTKSNPAAVLHRKYFDRIKERLEQTGHIPSFRHFLAAFVN
ncbi:MAG: hypothetical protein JW786_08605 [Desulfobacterales bacterium]|nr:hypothetical protein [Desulfobacterales bacterium]